MTRECSLTKVSESVSASAVLTLNVDLLTTKKSVLVTTVISPSSPKKKLGPITRKTVKKSGTIIKLVGKKK